MICIDKPTALQILGSITFLFMYGLAMFILGMIVTILSWIVIKTQAYRRPKRLLEALIGITKHWEEIKEWW